VEKLAAEADLERQRVKIARSIMRSNCALFQNGKIPVLSGNSGQPAADGLANRYDGPKLYDSLGAKYLLDGRFAAAIDCYRRVVSADPGIPEAWCNLGNALLFAGQVKAAMRCFRRALRISPDSHDARFGLAHSYLSSGLFLPGWREYERRPRKAMGIRSWRGEDLGGKKILLHAEQGLGDTLQFIRYAPLVVARGGDVVLQVQPELRRLLSDMRDIHLVNFDEVAAQEIVCDCALPSLPGIFGTQLHTIPASAGYLERRAEKVEQWSARLPQAGLKVGLAWAGNPRHGRDRHRSLSLQLLEPVLRISGVTFVSLQKGPAASQILQLPAGVKVLQVEDESGDLGDTADLIASLDLVISVDTVIAHLAGALGKSVWVLLPFVPDWRWLLRRSDSPWYGSARLFRQPSPGNWAEPIRQAASNLQKVAGQAHR
jgi:hypothetical protein